VNCENTGVNFAGVTRHCRPTFLQRDAAGARGEVISNPWCVLSGDHEPDTGADGRWRGSSPADRIHTRRWEHLIREDDWSSAVVC
jgi:hypothetical protein